MKPAPRFCRPCAPHRAVQIQCAKGNLHQADDEPDAGHAVGRKSNLPQADDEPGAGPAAGRVCELVNAGPP